LNRSSKRGPFEMSKIKPLLETAKTLTAIGLRVILLGTTWKSLMEWADYRECPLTETEIEKWFRPDNQGRTRAYGIAYALRGKEIACLSMDVDGKDAKEVFFNEFLPMLSKEAQEGFIKTTRTKTKSDGLHFLLEIDHTQEPFDSVAEIKQKGEWSSITIEGSTGQQTKHSQINMLGTENMSREYGPGYTSIISGSCTESSIVKFFESTTDTTEGLPGH
jgi:hypothetical protein